MFDHTLLWSLLELGWFALAATVILLDRRSAAATIAWLFVMAFLPVVGLIVYRLIGPTRLERKRLRRRAGRVAIEEATGAMTHLREVALEDLQVAAVPIALEQPLPLPASGVDLAESRAITASEIERQGLGQKLGQATARLLSPLL